MKKNKRKLCSNIIIFLVGSMLLKGCSQKDENIINMATKPMTEQYIIGSMVAQLIEQNTDLKIDITEGVGGGTSNIETGMESGKFDFYAEYTGTGWNEVLKKDSLYQEDMFEELQLGYHELGMKWTGMVGFNNTFGIAVRKEIADKYNLETYSDLSKVSHELKFGAEYDFYEREDGYDALCKTYSMRFKDTTDIDIGLKYEAIRQKKIDVMNVFTTDGQLASSDIKVLKDDKQLYPSYTCGFIVREEVLEKYPDLNKVLELFTNLISADEMAKMNYQVESENKEPEDVAKEFLIKKGLLK